MGITGIWMGRSNIGGAFILVVCFLNWSFYKLSSCRSWESSMSDLGLFDVMYSTRAMRRLKSDPVAPDLLLQVLEAGTQAASGQNTQPWSFIVVSDEKDKSFLATHYRDVMNKQFSDYRPKIEDQSKGARSMRAAWYLSDNLHNVPVLLLVCGVRDWPFSVPKKERIGKAPPSYGSVYPCIQNILLACRALGLGATLTTLHQVFESELQEYFAIPNEYGVVAMIPIGYPKGSFGPVHRKPAQSVSYLNRWGNNFPS